MNCANTQAAEDYANNFGLTSAEEEIIESEEESAIQGYAERLLSGESLVSWCFTLTPQDVIEGMQADEDNYLEALNAFVTNNDQPLVNLKHKIARALAAQHYLLRN